MAGQYGKITFFREPRKSLNRRGTTYLKRWVVRYAALKGMHRIKGHTVTNYCQPYTSHTQTGTSIGTTEEQKEQSALRPGRGHRAGVPEEKEGE